MKKQLYKKITKWKKKPKYDGLIGGLIFCICATVTLGLLFIKDNGNVPLTVIFTLMFVFGARLMIKSSGEDQRIYYLKVNQKRK